METSQESIRQDILELKQDLIKQDIVELKQDIAQLRLELIESFKTLTEMLTEHKQVNQRLSSHIDFVEQTYDTLKAPINFVKCQVERITGSKNEQLTDR